jgi:hypothetical protein
MNPLDLYDVVLNTSFSGWPRRVLGDIVGVFDHQEWGQISFLGFFQVDGAEEKRRVRSMTIHNDVACLRELLHCEGG